MIDQYLIPDKFSSLVLKAKKVFSCNWIGSSNFDSIFFIGSMGITILFIGTFYLLHFEFQVSPLISIPLIHFVFTGLFDFPHLLQTFLRSNYDSKEYNRHPFLYKYGLLFCLLAFIPIYFYDTYDSTIMLIRFWGYWHIMRQDWGLIRAYKIRNNDFHHLEELLDQILFYFSRVGCVVISEVFHSKLGLIKSFSSKLSFSEVLSIYLSVLGVIFTFYLIFQLWKVKNNLKVNLPKSLFLLVNIPGNIAIFLFLPFPAALDFVLCTAYHDVQYHGWTLFYGKKRFSGAAFINFKKLFKLTFLASLFITVPLVFFDSRATMLLLFIFVGYHYYVDGKIWKFSKAPELKNLISKSD